jgi:N-acetylmuramoyl-L-alanine amidase
VRQVRLGRQANKTTRIVLDAGGVSTYSIYALYEPYRLVIDCVRGLRPAPPPLPILGKYFIATWARKLPTISPHGSALIQAALPSTPPESTPPAAPPTSPTMPTGQTAAIPDKNATGGFSIARQLGLGVSRIVIDPGHGGHDPGAMGNGVSEAELVLDVALRLEKLLQKQPGTDVVLTRRTDDFVPLSERTAIANRESADLFLSIHANASEDGSARGIETYFLNFANNLTAAGVAARENAASGQAMGALPDFVKAIALNNKLDESRDFAGYVQRSMLEKLRVTNKTTKDLGVKQAPFVVLIGAAMPSVLAEISFVTNAQEARLLKSSAYRQRIADALFTAVRKYQSSLHTASGQAASASESGTESARTARLPAALPPPARRSVPVRAEERLPGLSDPDSARFER